MAKYDYNDALRDYKRPGCCPRTLSIFTNLSCPNLIQPLLHMVQHLADMGCTILRSQHSTPLLLKFFHTPFPLPLHFPPFTCTRVIGNHNNNHEKTTSSAVTNFRISEIRYLSYFKLPSCIYSVSSASIDAYVKQCKIMLWFI